MVEHKGLALVEQPQHRHHGARPALVLYVPIARVGERAWLGSGSVVGARVRLRAGSRFGVRVRGQGQGQG